MHDLLTTKRMENGIAVYWLEGNDRKLDTFNYQDLIDQEINALDLLDNPSGYRIDPSSHRIIMKK